jgi:hypothetical protein
MGLSPEMQDRLRIRELQRAARRTERNRARDAQQEIQDQERGLRQRILNDAREAGRIAAGNILTNVSLRVGGAAIIGWRLDQCDWHEMVEVPYGPIRDTERGGWDTGGIDRRDDVVGTNELLLVQGDNLWAVFHNAYRVGGHPGVIPESSIAHAAPLDIDDFGRWDPEVVDMIVFNFIDNNGIWAPNNTRGEQS